MRLLSSLLLLAWSATPLPAWTYDEAAAVPESTPRRDRHHLVGAMDLSFIHANSDFDSWLYHGSGKLRYDEEHDGLRVNRIFIADSAGQQRGTGRHV